jgi:hypothetical protein
MLEVINQMVEIGFMIMWIWTEINGFKWAMRSNDEYYIEIGGTKQ